MMPRHFGPGVTVFVRTVSHHTALHVLPLACENDHHGNRSHAYVLWNRSSQRCVRTCDAAMLKDPSDNAEAERPVLAR